MYNFHFVVFVVTEYNKIIIYQVCTSVVDQIFKNFKESEILTLWISVVIWNTVGQFGNVF